MKNELQQKLFILFPRLFRRKIMSPSQTYIFSGFECDDGWFDLIWRLSAMIEDVLKKESQEGYARQVKEKWGGLRFYMDGWHDEEIEGLIRQAEINSRKICELCGKTGILRKRRIWKTLCDECEILNYRKLN